MYYLVMARRATALRLPGSEASFQVGARSWRSVGASGAMRTRKMSGSPRIAATRPKSSTPGPTDALSRTDSNPCACVHHGLRVNLRAVAEVETERLYDVERGAVLENVGASEN